MTKRYKVTHESPGMRRILSTLQQSAAPLLDADLAARASLSISAVRRYRRDLHGAEKLHIADWQKSDHGRWVARWCFGPGEDAPRPPFCPLAASRAWRRRSRWEDARNAHAKAERRLKRIAKAPSLLAGIARMGAGS